MEWLSDRGYNDRRENLLGTPQGKTASPRSFRCQSIVDYLERSEFIFDTQQVRGRSEERAECDESE